MNWLCAFCVLCVRIVAAADRRRLTSPNIVRWPVVERSWTTSACSAVSTTHTERRPAVTLWGTIPSTTGRTSHEPFHHHPLPLPLPPLRPRTARPFTLTLPRHCALCRHRLQTFNLHPGITPQRHRRHCRSTSSEVSRRPPRQCHIKMFPPRKIRPGRDNHGFHRSPSY